MVISARNLGFLFLGLFSWAGVAKGIGEGAFPTAPNPELTPGATCATSNNYRYPEHIPYCERDVSQDEKAQVINTYDHELGYQIQKMDRQEFKIDHMIPLCAGGSNEETNL